MAVEVSLSDASSSPLIVDATYLGGSAGNASDDPISRILPVGNVGGIRLSGAASNPYAIVLVSSGTHTDWPDVLDPTNGEFVYYGDNRTPGKRQLHDTPRKGNVALRYVFENAANVATRRNVPPDSALPRIGEVSFVSLPGSCGPQYAFRSQRRWTSRRVALDGWRSLSELPRAIYRS